MRAAGILGFASSPVIVFRPSQLPLPTKLVYIADLMQRKQRGIRLDLTDWVLLHAITRQTAGLSA